MRTITLYDSQLVYTIGALISSIKIDEEFRIDSINKGLGHCNDVTELSITHMWSTIKVLAESLNHEYPRVDEDVERLKTLLNESMVAYPWLKGVEL